MSSGHDSYQGDGVKHSHDTGKLDVAAPTPATNLGALPDEDDRYPFKTQETEINPAATEHPTQPAIDQDA